MATPGTGGPTGRAKARMTAGRGVFVGFQIPRLDAHMAEHYGQQWTAYATRTKKLVPGLY